MEVDKGRRKNDRAKQSRASVKKVARYYDMKENETAGDG
jgi:hypothetical protein